MSKSGARILVVDDEIEIVRALSRSLTAHGYAVLTARTGEEAIRTTFQNRPDLLLLDLLLPGMNGIEVCQRIREHSNVPIIVLSVKEKERDKVEALDLGADDYIQKPFGMNEVLARIRVALRHVASTQAGTEAKIQVGSLLVDFAQRRVQRNEHVIDLTPTEYDLLKVLLTHRGKILTRQMLLQEVWGEQGKAKVHSLHVYVASLRQKIEADPLHPRFILTVPGVGYRFNEEVPAEPLVQIGPLHVDFAQRQVFFHGHVIDLTPTECDLLKVLLTHRGKDVTQQMMLQHIWGEQGEAKVHSLHVYVASLRQKIEADPHHPRFILTVPGVGYRFDEEVPAE
jgi:two-component system, OmpR family, KDP operon response regulator KdpE